MNSKNFTFRAIATLLCIVMMVGMIPVYVAADTDYVVEASTVTLNKSTAVEADGYYTVNVPINLTTNRGLVWIDFDVNYDETLDLVDWTEGVVFPFRQADLDDGVVDYEMSANNATSRQPAAFENNPFRVSYQAPTRIKDNTTTGTLINLVFKVSKDTPAGEYPITIKMDTILSQRDTDSSDGSDPAVDVTIDYPDTVSTVAGMIKVVDNEDAPAIDYVVEASEVTLDMNTAVATEGYYTVNVPINVTTNRGLVWIDLYANYAGALDLVDWTEGEVFPFDQDDLDEGVVDYEKSANNMTSRQEEDFDKNPFFISYQAPTRIKDNTTTGTLINLVFKVAANTPAGDYPITITMNSINSQRDTDGSDGYDTPVNVTKKYPETISTVAGKVTIVAKDAESTDVTFVADDKTFATLKLVVGKELVYPESTPTAANKKFVRWDVPAGTPVTADMTVNAVFTDIEAPIGVVSGRDMRFNFKNLNSLGIFMNGKGFTGGSRLTFEANGDSYSLTAYDPEFAFDPATGVWKFVESINGNYGIDQNINVYLNLSADADYLAIGYALNSPNGVNANGITVHTDKGDTVVPATFDNSGEMTSLVLDLTTLPEDAKNIRYIKIMPWGGSKIAKGSYIHIAYVAAFANKVDAEAYDPMVDYVSPAKYNVTINPAENGVLWYNYDQAVTEIINDTYYAEENVYLWATPNEGYIFKGWKNGNDFIEPDATKFYWGDSSVAPSGKTYTVTTSDTVKAAVFAVDGALDITPVFEREVQPVKLEATATANGTFKVNGGESLSEYTAEIDPETELTFVATANIGYKLDGWYDITNGKNRLLTKDATLVYTVGDKDAKIEVRFMDETITIASKLAVETNGNGKVSIAGGEEVKSYLNYANGGNRVKLVAVADEGYAFAYWSRKSDDGAEVYIGANTEVEVSPLGAEVAYIANFVAEGDKVNLYVTDQKYIISNTEQPEAPEKFGYVAVEGKWKQIVETENVVVSKPVYVKADDTNTLTINYADGSVKTIQFKYAEGFTVVATKENPVWTLTVGEGEPSIVSYSKSFVIHMPYAEDVTLVETEEENAQDAEAMITSIRASYIKGEDRIMFVAMFELPEGAKLVDRGVLLTSDESVANNMDCNTPGVIVGSVPKPVETATKTFAISKTKVADGSTWYGKPYIIYTLNGETYTEFASTMSATAE